MRFVSRSLRILLKIFIGIFALVILYTIAGYVAMYIPVNRSYQPCENNCVEIYLRSNGIHTDLVFPIENKIRNWKLFVNPDDARNPGQELRFVGFGWGDKGFYMDTPTWADLKFTTAIRAILGKGGAAMHVVYYENIQENELCVKVHISEADYKKLADYVSNSFESSNGKAIVIPNTGYWENDAFYEARGTYYPFMTCNTWTNAGLKEAHMKACLWTPFDKGILYHYQH